MNIICYNYLPETCNNQLKFPIFASQAYANYLAESKSIQTMWFVEEVEGIVSFMIPFAILKKSIFKKGYFLTAVNNLNGNPIEKENEFLESVICLIRERKICDWIQQSPNWAIFNRCPKNSISCQFGSYRINFDAETISSGQDTILLS